MIALYIVIAVCATVLLYRVVTLGFGWWSKAWRDVFGRGDEP